MEQLACVQHFDFISYLEIKYERNIIRSIDTILKSLRQFFFFI